MQKYRVLALIALGILAYIALFALMLFAAPFPFFEIFLIASTLVLVVLKLFDFIRLKNVEHDRANAMLNEAVNEKEDKHHLRK
ncbi:MAG: hypothetical protein ACRESX_02120 [Gammaproteobacteria bacterium]